ncbi:GNAT family N-acetyltransferase [Sphingobacterium sp. ML3W]
MRWRNEQIYHLRQNKVLTEKDQEQYFDTVVRQLFEQDFPNQILFSYLENGICIGYGGLVHINWIDKNAEISFIIKTELEETSFEFHWEKYLSILSQIAFRGLSLHKIYTYAFDLRPRLYVALKRAGFDHEATLKDHCFFEGKYIDVLYHAKLNTLSLRAATLLDCNLTYVWASDPCTRKYSFNQNQIEKKEHIEWFNNKIQDPNCFYFILEDSMRNPLGSVRIDVKENNQGIISYLIDSKYYGRGLGTAILRLAEEKAKDIKIPIDRLIGYVLKENIASIKIFNKLDYSVINESENLKFYKELQ